MGLFSPAASLVGVGETFFARNPVESQVVLASLPDASDLLRLLLDGGNSTKAGYLAGAFRRIGRPELADEIVRSMKRGGYDVRESDPFEATQSVGKPRPSSAPIAGRLEMMREATREAVIKDFPKAPGPSKRKRQGGVSSQCRRNLSERRLSLPLDRGLLGFGRSDRKSPRRRMEP